MYVIGGNAYRFYGVKFSAINLCRGNVYRLERKELPLF